MFAALPFRDRLAADPVEPVAARNEKAVEPLALTLVREVDVGGRLVEVMYRDVRHFVQDRRTHDVLRLVEILRHLGLPVDRDVLAGKLFEINSDHKVLVGQETAVVRDGLAIQPVRHACLAQHPHRAGLQDAGPDAGQHMLARRPFKDEGLHTRTIEKLRQKEAGGSAPDDGHLGLHAKSPASVILPVWPELVYEVN